MYMQALNRCRSRGLLEKNMYAIQVMGTTAADKQSIYTQHGIRWAGQLDHLALLCCRIVSLKSL